MKRWLNWWKLELAARLVLWCHPKTETGNGLLGDALREIRQAQEIIGC